MNYEDDEDSSFNDWMINAPPKPIPKLFTTKDEEYGPKPVKVKPTQTDDDGEEVEDDGYRKPFFNPNGREVVPDNLRSGVMASMKLTIEQHKLFIALGGTAWLKEQLAKANVQRDKCKRLKERDRIAAFRLKRDANAKLKVKKDTDD